MYLVRINPKTNLVDIEDTQDGVLSIKAFSDVINHKDFGLECFTCIALAVDYASPMRRYPYKERPAATMRFVTGKADKWGWAQDLIMEACGVYEQLQFNPDLEQINLLKEMEVDKLAELSVAKDFYERKTAMKELDEIKQMKRKYTDEDESRLIDESETKKNGYKLSRLEMKLKNKNTFYHVRRKKQRERVNAEREQKLAERSAERKSGDPATTSSRKS